MRSLSAYFIYHLRLPSRFISIYCPGPAPAPAGRACLAIPSVRLSLASPCPYASGACFMPMMLFKVTAKRFLYLHLDHAVLNKNT